MDKHRRIIASTIALLWLALLSACATVDTPTGNYYGVRFIDERSQRGVPAVVMTTNHGIVYVSDSDGYVAIPRDVIHDRPLYFHVTSDGYQASANKNGFRGIAVSPGQQGTRVVSLQRTSVAERLYRITGEGIYHDSELLGVALKQPELSRPRGGVYGQDSVINAIYDDQLYWFWGDTKLASTPLGLFKVSGAVAPLPGNGKDPDDGVDLAYFVDDNGLSRDMSPIEAGGVIWLSGLTVLEEQGRQHMFAFYTHRAGLSEELGRGIVMWNDTRQTFEQWAAFSAETPLHPRGRDPLLIDADGEQWLHYGLVFPQVRVRAALEEVRDATRYQAYTCLQAGARWDEDAPALAFDEQGQLDWDWRYDTDVIDASRWQQLVDKGLVKEDRYWGTLIDAESGEPIAPHRGHIAWNEHRRRWVLIATQMFGSSMLGEVWYAEADHPLGPWSKARKVATHEDYSFYNPKQHPYFAKGPYIYFEGTYTKTFSGTKRPTPRYDYNQIMYRLNLDDPRLQGLSRP